MDKSIVLYMLKCCKLIQVSFDYPRSRMELTLTPDFQLDKKLQILEFESQLVAASSTQLITWQNWPLLSTITSMNPHDTLSSPLTFPL